MKFAFGVTIGMVCAVAMAGEPDFVAEPRAAEAKRLEASAGLARRDGERLILSTAGGKSLELLDRSGCESAATCQLHVWEGLQVDSRFHQVWVRAYEGQSWLWVDRQLQGLQAEVPALPRVSPDARLLLAVSASEAHDPQGLWLWQITSNGLRKRLVHEGAAFRFVAWRGRSEARLQRLTVDSRCRHPLGYRATPYRLRLAADGTAQLTRERGPQLCVGEATEMSSRKPPLG
jgi:hypothetical protein